MINSSDCKRRATAPRKTSLSDRKRPLRKGEKSALIGLKGAVRVTCKPRPARFSPELSVSSAVASLLLKCGDANMIEVALIRPCRISLRMPAFTPGEIP